MTKEYKSGLDPFQLDFIPFDEVADRLTVRLLNPEHTDILDQVPHREICGIVEVCCLSVKADETGKSFLTVTNRMAEAWGLSENELFRAAEEASARNNPATLRPLLSVLHSMTCGGKMPELLEEAETTEEDPWDDADSMAGDGLWNSSGAGEEEPGDEKEPGDDEDAQDSENLWEAEELTLAQETAENQLYIATNSDSVLGAGVIMYPGFLREASKVLGGNFYLLPSSIHEFLFLPDTGDCDFESLNDMVKTINENEVTLREQLSDHVLYYDCRKEELREPGTYRCYSFTAG